MNPLSESTFNLFLSGLMGALGSLVLLPINALISWQLKREELLYQHKLDIISKQRELLLQHKLEMERKSKDDEINQIKERMSKLEQVLRRVVSTNE